MLEGGQPAHLSGELGLSLAVCCGTMLACKGRATLSSLIPQVLMAAGIPLTGATRASVLGLAELLTSLLIGWTILTEPVHRREILGASLILLAIFVSRPPKHIEL